MSLLLDARKKSKISGPSNPGSPLEMEPITLNSQISPITMSEASARAASQNLFKVKTDNVLGGKVSKNIVYALLGTLGLLASGAGYVWYAINADNRPIDKPVLNTAAIAPSQQNIVVAPSHPSMQQVPEPSTPPPENGKMASVAPENGRHATKHASLALPRPAERPAKTETAPNDSFHFSKDSGDSQTIILDNAYQAYQNGKFDIAETRYRQALKIDPNNTDTLLGLAAIAQHRGYDSQAAQYYSKVLVIDPRNPVANSGMASLTAGNNHESNLKILLSEQQDSPSLQFALGNQYAVQSRWSEAQQAYFDAFNLDPSNAQIVFNLAISLEHLGKNKLAARYYQRALELDTSDTAGFDHLAISKHAAKLNP